MAGACMFWSLADCGNLVEAEWMDQRTASGCWPSIDFKENSGSTACSLFGESLFEYSAWVTDLLPSQFDACQIAEMYQGRADCENVYDELKNQWGLAGFCSQQSNVTELAARLTLLSYNLWSLFVRFFNLKKHQEAKTSRKDFMLIASQYVSPAANGSLSSRLRMIFGRESKQVTNV